MKIIKHGSKHSENKIAVCPLCGCEFEYDSNDTEMDKAFCFTTECDKEICLGTKIVN